MYGFDKKTTNREQQRLMFQNEVKNPSFSSTLLDKIYRSIDEGDRRRSNVNNDMKFHNETMLVKKQSTKSRDRVIEEVQQELTAASIRRACLLEKLKVSEKTVKTERKSRLHDYVHDQDVMFLTSTSSSSDSSSGLLSSSSDTESLYGTRSKTRVSCFAPRRRLKPVITSASNDEEDGLIKSKSRANKIYDNLKKVKQPISPGGKLSNFLNSLFTTGNGKKTKTYDEAKPVKSGQDSTCSTASSFSRSCLSKASSGDKSRDGVKRTVRFYPLSVIVDEDCRPCGHKCLYEEDTRVMALSVPTAWKIGRSKSEEEQEKVVDKSRRVEETAREFLKEYHRSQRKSDLVLRDYPIPIYDDHDDDDAASTSSSDLFELDHLSVIGNNHRYSEELPVFETTHLSTNRAIANGLV